MPIPMIGGWTVTIDAARPFAIHGDLYVELTVTHADSGERAIVRVPQHALSGAAPTPGERYELTFLMGQVTGAKRLA